jgi:hypothetical protein
MFRTPARNYYLDQVTQQGNYTSEGRLQAGYTNLTHDAVGDLPRFFRCTKTQQSGQTLYNRGRFRR